MTGQVILVEVVNVIRSLLSEHLPEDLAVGEAASTEQLFYELEQSRHVTETLVLGVRVDDPVSIAQRVHFLGKHLPVFILSAPDGCAQLKQALQFSPFVGSEVTAWSIENIDALPAAVRDAASRYKRRRDHQGTIQAAQRRLGALMCEPPQLTHYLDRLIDRAPIGVLNVEATGKILSLNRCACHILGLTEREAIGLDVASLFASSELTRFKAMMARLVAPSKKRPAEVFEISSSARDPTFVEVTAESLIDRSGQLGSTMIFQDVTDRIQAEHERKQAEERERQHMLELAHVSRVTTLGEMTSQLAHELAQPLMAIANFSDASLRMLQASTESRSEVVESFTDILAQADRAREIIAQLRTLMRKNELRSAPEDINELVREVVRLSQAEARWHDLDLRLELAHSLPPVSVDKTLVEQVILNLVHNAVETLQTVRRHRRRLEIRTLCDSSEQILVEVSDNGPGLPGDSNRIFEPFFTTKPEGMGMGLAICRSIISAHQGRLWASANEFGGATFRFTLAAHIENVSNEHSASQGLHR